MKRSLIGVLRGLQIGSVAADRYQAKQGLISVVIPVYNREAIVGRSLHRIREVLSSISSNYEMIVVNDGSTDKTLEALQREQLSDNHLKIITYSDNMGKGYAVRRGVADSLGDIVVFTDGDLDISPSLIGEYVGQLQSHDLVIASKRHPLSVVRARMSRRILSRLFNFIVRIIVGIRATDTQAGMKVGKGAVVREIFEVMLVKRYAFDVELLAIARMLNKDIKEMPVEINLDRKFKVGDMLRMFQDVLAIGYRLRIRHLYQKQLSPE